MDDNIEFYFEEYGGAISSKGIASEKIQPLNGIMPPQYLEILNKIGECIIRGGRTCVIHPSILQETLDLILFSDKDLGGGKSKPYTYTVFGDITFWHEEIGVGVVNLLQGIVQSFALTNGSDARTDFFAEADLPFSGELEEDDILDDEGVALYNRSLKKLGGIEFYECYGFVPVLSLGGDAKLTNLEKMSAPEHFSILAQSTEFSLVSSSSPDSFEVIRQIGK